MTKLEDHEKIDRYIGNVAPQSQRLDGSMEPDVDGDWIRLSDVQASILRADDSFRRALEEIMQEVGSSSRAWKLADDALSQ